MIREFSREKEIENFFEVGRMGIEHALLPEKGIVTAGDLVIGADSHTCTYGALGAFSTGVGSTDLGCSMAAGTTWFKVPPTIKVVFNGKLNKYVTAKDLILHLIGDIGVDGALYQTLEIGGSTIRELPMSDTDYFARTYSSYSIRTSSLTKQHYDYSISICTRSHNRRCTTWWYRPRSHGRYWPRYSDIRFWSATNNATYRCYADDCSRNLCSIVYAGCRRP